VHDSLLAQLRGLDSFLEAHHVLPKLTPPTDIAKDSEGKVSETTKKLREGLSELTLSNRAVWEREER
jgi:hypothetical protein